MSTIYILSELCATYYSIPSGLNATRLLSVAVLVPGNVMVDSTNWVENEICSWKLRVALENLFICLWKDVIYALPIPPKLLSVSFVLSSFFHIPHSSLKELLNVIHNMNILEITDTFHLVYLCSILNFNERSGIINEEQDYLFKLFYI